MTGRWMPKPQPRGVQEMTPWRQGYQPPPAAAAVRIVADDRVSDRCDVHAALMRATGVEVRAQQVRGVEAGKPQKVRLRRPSAGDDRHPLPVSRVPRNGPVDRQAIGVDMPPDKCRGPTNDAAVSQCEKRSKELNRSTLCPERPFEIRRRPMIR